MFTQQLKLVEEKGASFEDGQLKWNNAEDVKDVIAALDSSNVIHYLKLDGNTLGVEAASAIGKALENHPEFRKALWKNLFVGRLKSEIPIALKHLGSGLVVAKAQLTVLDLSDNALGPNGMVGLEDLLRSPTCYSLQELHLNNCGLGIYGGRMLSQAILDCHRASRAAGSPLKLKVFVAGRNRLENEGAKAIAKIFSTLKTLQEICMPQNSIYHVGIAALADGFKENRNLHILNLNDNTVTHKGAAALSEAFTQMPHLRNINFGDCLLRTNGAYYFAEALSENHNELQVVDLGFNEIGPDGGLALASAMQNKPDLKSLNLDGNQFGYEACDRIKETMQSSANPNALAPFEEDQSECEEEAGEEDEDDDDDENEYEEDVYDDEHQNDTTEEADDDEEYHGEHSDGDGTDESAYTTSQAFNTKLVVNESLNSYKSVNSDAEAIKVDSAELFCLSGQPCTIKAFESLPEANKLEAFMGIINKFSGDNYLLLLIFTTLKCAHLAQSSSEALELAKILYAETFNYAARIRQERRVLNYVLIQLGFLRSERKFTPIYNSDSCHFALSETLSKGNISSSYTKNVCNVFLSKLDSI